MTKQDLRIIFMGTPDFAVPTLQAMLREGYNVVAVVTQPDRPVGRHGSQLQPSAVKVCALEAGIPVLQPEKMRDPAFIEALRSYGANLQVVVAFRMLPEVVWAMPEYGTFNVHASLLPQYRGAAPINWAVINGESQTGVTTFFLDHEIDTGRVIMQLPMDIAHDANAGDVHDALMGLGAEICLQTLQRIVDADGHPQAMEQASLPGGADALRHAPKIFKDTCRIDWGKPAESVRNFVRGLSPYPGSWTTLAMPDGRSPELKIYAAETLPSTYDEPAGTIVRHGKCLAVVCGDGHALAIATLQLSGKKRMAAADFVNGMKDIDCCHVE